LFDNVYIGTSVIAHFASALNADEDTSKICDTLIRRGQCNRRNRRVGRCKMVHCPQDRLPDEIRRQLCYTNCLQASCPKKHISNVDLFAEKGEIPECVRYYPSFCNLLNVSFVPIFRAIIQSISVGKRKFEVRRRTRL
jgi:hypothetical protein